MNGVGLILVSTTITVTLGAIASISIGGAILRDKEIATALTSGGDGRARHAWNWIEKLDRSRLLRRPARMLNASGLVWSPSLVALIILSASIAVYFLLRPFVGYVASCLIMLATPLVFDAWLRHRIAGRSEQFISQLPELARFLSNGVSAGLSIERSLALAARELPEPSRSEIHAAVARLELGWSLEGVFDELSARLPSRELDVLVRTVVIQARSGGALIGALQDIAGALEDRKQLHREIRTVILGTAFGAYLVPGIGVAAVILMNMMRPGVLDDMMSSTLGRIILLVASFFFGLGMIMMRVVSRIEV